MSTVAIRRRVIIEGQCRSRTGWQATSIELDDVTLREAAALAVRSGIVRITSITVEKA
jgi:hypothetical protein